MSDNPELQQRLENAVKFFNAKYEAEKKRLTEMPVADFMELARDLKLPTASRRTMVDQILRIEFPAR